jgi:hypothetical protein
MESKRLLSFSLVALLTIGVSKAREFPWEHPMTDAAGQGGGGGELKVEVPWMAMVQDLVLVSDPLELPTLLVGRMGPVAPWLV